MPAAVNRINLLLIETEKNNEVYKLIAIAQRVMKMLVKTNNLKALTGQGYLFSRLITPALLRSGNIGWMCNLGCVFVMRI